ncbi:hypothetical protein CBM2633_A70120 [Cupriavidus taiwanensis]|nr:hypothetical protein CBM2633_A70120 [Cupriavidus taiwanensis]
MIQAAQSEIGDNHDSNNYGAE